MTQPLPHYLVLCGHHIDEYAPERDAKDMDRATTIKDIVDGQFQNLTRVIEVGTNNDVTLDLAREVMTVWAHQGEPLSFWQYEFVELHIGTRAARSFLRAA